MLGRMMNIDQIIALSACLISLLVALATFLTVRQIAKQRRSSFKPELILARSTFTARNRTVPYRWSFSIDEEKTDALVSDKPDESSLKRNFHIAIPLLNIGLGAAKEVVIEWNFDIDRAIEIVNSIRQKLLLEGYIENTNDIISFHSNSGEESMHSWLGQKRNSLDYVLASDPTIESETISVPPLYLELYCQYQACIFKQNDSEKVEFPHLTAIMTHKDIGEIAHAAAFKLNFDIIMLMSNKEMPTKMTVAISPEKLHDSSYQIEAIRLLKDIVAQSLPKLIS